MYAGIIGSILIFGVVAVLALGLVRADGQFQNFERERGPSSMR